MSELDRKRPRPVFLPRGARAPVSLSPGGHRLGALGGTERSRSDEENPEDRMGTGSGDPQAWARPQSPPTVLRKRAGHASHREGRTKICPRAQSLELVGGSRKRLRTRAQMTTAPRRCREAKAPTPVLSPHLLLTTPRNPLTPPGLGPHVCKMKKPSPEWCVCVCVCVCVCLFPGS